MYGFARARCEASGRVIRALSRRGRKTKSTSFDVVFFLLSAASALSGGLRGSLPISHLTVRDPQRHGGPAGLNRRYRNRNDLRLPSINRLIPSPRRCTASLHTCLIAGRVSGAVCPARRERSRGLLN